MVNPYLNISVILLCLFSSEMHSYFLKDITPKEEYEFLLEETGILTSLSLKVAIVFILSPSFQK
jgi:hypothetical protein|tara:strand:- start:33 stop:224 length:192 start_codon:yes stop_codon:yes gene_type:complete